MNLTDVSPTPQQSWPEHVRRTLELGLPLIGAQLAVIGLGVTDTIMLGWLGAEPLAAGVLGTSLLFVTMIGGSGFAHAVAPLVSSAVGAGDARTARRSVRMALWGSALYCLIAWWHLWFSEGLFLFLGQEPELAKAAQDYLRIAMWSLPCTLFFQCFRSFLSAVGHAHIVLWGTLSALILNGLLNYALIFGNWGAPALGIRGSAIATLGSALLVFALSATYAAWQRDMRPFEVIARWWEPDFPALAELFRLAWPISLTLLAEVSLFSLTAFMMGWLGVLPLAAHGIAIQIISVLFMIPLGLSFAATVRIGHQVGRKDRVGLYRASVTVTALALAIAVFCAVVLVAVPEPLIRLFLDEANPDAAVILEIGVPLLMVAALFQLADGAQAIALGLLRGIKDTAVPMYIAAVSYLGFGLGVGYLLGFTAGLGGVGVWLGLAAGLALASVLLGWRYARRMPHAIS